MQCTMYIHLFYLSKGNNLNTLIVKILSFHRNPSNYKSNNQSCIKVSVAKLKWQLKVKENNNLFIFSKWKIQCARVGKTALSELLTVIYCKNTIEGADGLFSSELIVYISFPWLVFFMALLSETREYCIFRNSFSFQFEERSMIKVLNHCFYEKWWRC